MYLLKTNESLKVGEYLSTSLEGNDIVFFQNNKKLGTTIARDKKIFKNRTLKAVVREKTEEGYRVSIIRFADLHRHSGYSLLDGSSKIEDMVKKTEYVGALTDHGNMYGFLEYYKQMKKAGKQPILGFEAYAETIEGNKESNHLILLAKNNVGYKNLIKLTSLAYENFYRHPHVSYEMLEKHNEGLIATSACIGGEIPQKIKDGDYEKAKEIALKYQDIFGEDFYIEIQRHNIGIEEDKINEGLIKLSKEINAKLVATTDSHYTNKEDSEVHQILLCLQTGKTLSDDTKMTFPGTDYHIHTPDEMDKKFKDIPEAIDNTLEIAEKCSSFELELGNLHMPKFEVPAGYTENSYFEKIVWKGFEDRFKDKKELEDKKYINRVKYEIDIIEQMGYASYFLIVADFINYAKDNGIMVGPGRGSAVGSLVSYCLGIVDLDPIPYNLLFERFLNPERVSMPDIDVDFCYERREEVIDYVRNKYGEEAVSKIITFGTLSARSVVRDVARVMDYPYSLGDRIAKNIPETPGITIIKAMEENPELKSMYQNEFDIKRVIDTALRLEGLPRHASQHACGIVIAPSAVDDYLPETMMGKKGKEKERTSQVTMTEVEELGLLKMDFLGLRTMTVIGKTIETIGNIDYYDIIYYDPYVFSDIAKGETYGVFQLESVGMREFMKMLYADVDYKIKMLENKHKVKGFKNPQGTGDKEEFIKDMTALGQELFERLIAGVSLYRPGPMDYIPDYIDGMTNPKNIKYDTPELKPILETTYGQIVYQEQVMQIVQELAGYTLGRADIVRRAMGKKKDDVMAQEKEYFINGKNNTNGEVEVPGCINNGISKEVAEVIWNKMADFSKYAFNKSHAAAYALIGIKTAWLKYYYPVEFMTATINSFIDNTDKLKLYLSVCNKMNIEILPPSINKSQKLFSVEGNKIRFGIMGLKNIGKSADAIIKTRKDGLYESIQDFVERMAIEDNITKRIYESLVFAGAFDEFQGSRQAKLKVMDKMLILAKRAKEDNATGQVHLFDMPEFEEHKAIKIPDVPEFEKQFKLAKEKEFAGFYITEHPLDEYEKYLKLENVLEIGTLVSSDDDNASVVTENYNNMDIKIAGIVKDIKVFYTKKDYKPLYVFNIEDRSGELKCVVFYNQLEFNQDKIIEGNIVLIDGTLKEDDWGLQLIVKNMIDIETLKDNSTVPKYLSINARNKEEMYKITKEVLNVPEYGGHIPIIINLKGQRYKSQKKINLNNAILMKLENIVGSSRYKIVT